MKDLPPFTLVHRPKKGRLVSRPRGDRKAAPARAFRRLTVAEFAQVLARFVFRRQVNVVHLHHTWRPNHAQYEGHPSIVAMWRQHTETNGWSDIAQHVSIGPEGAIWTGRDWNVPPASAAGHNGNADFGPFMIEMIGDFDEGHDAWEGEQRTAALAVIAAVQRRFSLPPQALRFHRQMSTKTCPGSSLDYDEVVRELTKLHAATPAAPVVSARGARAAVRAVASVDASPARMEAGDAEPSESGARLGKAIAVKAALKGVPGAAPASGSREAADAAREARKGAIRVGLWDLDAYVGGLPRVIEALNAAQDTYAFFESLAVVSAGIISEPKRVQAWSRERRGSGRLGGIERNAIAGDFFERAETVRRGLGLGFLAGITSSMIADEDEQQVYYNLFSTSRGRLLLVSSYDLRAFARKAGRTFEAAVLGVTIAQLLAARHERLGFHEDRGCLFDENETRSTIVKVLRRPRIEPSCLALIPEADRAAASALVSALDAYGRGGSR